jgi:hypothetical protein
MNRTRSLPRRFRSNGLSSGLLLALWTDRESVRAGDDEGVQEWEDGSDSVGYSGVGLFFSSSICLVYFDSDLLSAFIVPFSTLLPRYPIAISLPLPLRLSSLLSSPSRSVAFVKTWHSPSSTPREKISALRKACKAHTELTKQCAQGLGQDRVLYAMYCLAQQRKRERTLSAGSVVSAGGGGGGEDSDDSEQLAAKLEARIPEVFKDPGYARLGHSTLSTSNCGNPCLRLFGFGSVVTDGFGLGYIISSSFFPFFLPFAVLTPFPTPRGRRYLDLPLFEAPTDAALRRYLARILRGGNAVVEAVAR